MSERNISKHEQHESSESINDSNEIIDALVHEKQEKAKQAEQDATSHLESARKAAEQHAKEGKQVEAEDENKHQVHNYGSHQLLKKDAYKQILKRTQKKLSAPSRAFSKLIHNQTVESVSEVAGKTAARPSGLLGGGVGAFVGSLGLFYTARHYGFSYNYSLLILLFAGGFLVGLALELLLKVILPKKH